MEEQRMKDLGDLLEEYIKDERENLNDEDYFIILNAGVIVMLRQKKIEKIRQRKEALYKAIEENPNWSENLTKQVNKDLLAKGYTQEEIDKMPDIC